MRSAAAALGQPERMESYYRLHSRVYDLTRWSFLFGRRELVAALPKALPAPRRVLEVGCGTGDNLLALSEAFPDAAVVGVDVSRAMLDVAERKLSGRRVKLVHASYDAGFRVRRPFDLVVCSYCLTMINPGWEAVVDKAHADLRPGGLLAVADFHATSSRLFNRWMGFNHVRLDGQLPERLDAKFKPALCEVRPAYFGLWSYLLYLGERRPSTNCANLHEF